MMTTGHDLFVKGLAALGHSLGHPEAEAILEKAKEFVESTEAKVLGAVAHHAPTAVQNAVEVQETKELNEASLAKAKAEDAAASHS